MAPTPAEHAFFEKREDSFNRAMVANDVLTIQACTTDDWVLVTPESGPVSRDAILHVVGSAILTPDSMTSVAFYGTTAVVTGRGQNTGTFKGEQISADEWITDVYHHGPEGWRCVLTHPTPASQTSGQDQNRPNWRSSPTTWAKSSPNAASTGSATGRTCFSM